PLAERHDEPGILGDRNEFGRGDGATAFIVPARKRLEARDPAAAQFDERLEGKLQPVFLDRAPERGLEAEAIVGEHSRLRLVNFDAVGLLRALQGDLRVTDLVADIGVMPRLNGAAERAIDAD